MEVNSVFFLFARKVGKQRFSIKSVLFLSFQHFFFVGSDIFYDHLLTVSWAFASLDEISLNNLKIVYDEIKKIFCCKKKFEICNFCYNITNMNIFFLVIILPRIMNWSKVWRMAKCCPRTYIMFGLMVRSFFLTELRTSSSEGRNISRHLHKNKVIYFFYERKE